jgi:chromosome segregation ATPase
MDITPTPITGFDKALEQLLHFGDSLERHQKQLEQKYAAELDQQKKEFNVQLQKEKQRVVQLQKTDRALTEQIEQMTEKLIDLNETCTVINAKYISYQDELTQFKKECSEKNLKIQQLEKDISISKDDLVKLKIEHQHLLDKVKEMSSRNYKLTEKLNKFIVIILESVCDEHIRLDEKTVDENQRLKKKLTEYDNEIVRFNEQLNKLSQEIAQRIMKLKEDFRIMYDQQSTFFLRKITLLKEEQRLNNAKLYQYNS